MSKSIKYLFIITLLAASLLTFVVVNAAARPWVQTPLMSTVQTESPTAPRTITVVGEGKVSLEPDIAIINVGAEARAKTVSEAKAEVDNQMAEITSALQSAGVAEEDIQTSSYYIRYMREPIPLGEGPALEIQEEYSVSNMVRVTVRQVGRAGDMLDTAVQAGANQVFGVTFTVSDESTWKSQARTSAMTDAKSRAQELANLADIGLGEVISVSEVIGGMSIPALVGADGPKGGGAGVNPGELELSTLIQVTFAVQ